MKKRRRVVIVWVLLLFLGLAGSVVLVRWAVRQVRIYRQVQSASNLSRIGLAISLYEAANGSYPPEYIVDKKGRRLHSWRVLILPYLGYGDLFKRYDMSEPWDSPKNRALAREMPIEYRSPYGPSGSTLTPYLAVSGPGTAWPGAKGIKRSDIKDGPSSTIMLVEAANSDVNWMEPRDIDFSVAAMGIHADDSPGIKSYRPDGIRVLLGDGGTTRLPVDASPDLIKAMLTIAGNEPLEELEDGTFILSKRPMSRFGK